MPPLTETGAIAAARRSLGLEDTDAGAAWRVQRLDGHGEYFLVFVAQRVACVDAGDGTLLASAQATRAPVVVTDAQAVARSGLGTDAQAHLVWKACAASRSMFDPLWEVVLGTQRIYVDQRGAPWTNLMAAGPGG